MVSDGQKYSNIMNLGKFHKKIWSEQTYIQNGKCSSFNQAEIFRTDLSVDKKSCQLLRYQET